MSTQTVFLHQAIAQSVGLNATDTSVSTSSSVERAAPSLRAGSSTRLTTGAVLDRLEKRRLVERVRDTQDCRKVFIRVRPEGLEPLIPKYEEIGEAYMGLAER